MLRNIVRPVSLVALRSTMAQSLSVTDDDGHHFGRRIVHTGHIAGERQGVQLNDAQRELDQVNIYIHIFA